MLSLKTKLSDIPRIGPKYAAALKKLNMETVEDFLLHFPFRYEDYSERVAIDNLAAGQTATVMGEVTKSKLIRTWKKKMLITECFVQDDTGTVRAVWFNQPYVSDSLTEGKGVRLSGKVSEDAKGLFFSNPAWELSSRIPTNTGRLVPIYPETEGLTSKWIRWQLQNLIKFADELQDPIPENILKGLHLPSLSEAIKYIHFPKNAKQAEIAQKRFAFQQMFLLQLASQRAKISWERQQSVTIPFDEKLMQKFVAALPFSLTNAQRKAAFQILKDLEKPRPMNRLLNGDVGSGKTVVAAMAALSVINSGYQVAIMAPTEVLARQHYLTLSALLKNRDINIALLTNSYKEINNFQFPISNFQTNPNFQNSKLKIQSKFKIRNSKLGDQISRDELISQIKFGAINLVIGTHALIQKGVKFKNLALVVIDEQHRFGVDQRAYLQQPASTRGNDRSSTRGGQISEINDGLPEKTPHLLSMSATPIPRTLAMAFFGNLDLSVLDEMPKNRKTIKTKIITAAERQKTYDFVRSEIKNGRQVFIIFPLVEESQKMSELKAATEEHARLSKNVFPDLKLALLHGRLKSNEKEKIMQDFNDKKYDILVSTSVVEVGIDIPNASIMIIEDADRFGLSQLHQFRGRVGRAEHQSYCFLFAKSSALSKSRLKAMEKYASGFDIAEEDFKLRGPGEFFGTRQSGLPDI
ncbi:MAG TPA: ATP-dependent DNA helicase RecG, partial [Candidatus Moranbacteria bacterium]|nr:ATP-dependent DNA helicase RecG [Candidatus Moranbacteria bacterium]